MTPAVSSFVISLHSSARMVVPIALPSIRSINWQREVTRWHDRASALAAGRVPQPDTEYLLWQTLVGAWPISPARVAGYLRKAMREAKTATSWTDPDPGYEAGCGDHPEGCGTDGGSLRPILPLPALNGHANGNGHAASNG